MHTIEDRYDEKRGCGWRKAGGKYLVSAGPAEPCERLPIPLAKCPTCSCGIKPARGWAWLKLGPILSAAKPCPIMLPGTADAVSTSSVVRDVFGDCRLCVLCNPTLTPERVGLLWVGGVFYPTAESFMEEARRQGISRRLSQIPKDFKVGETWVLLAHRKPEPHAFAMFRPQRIEYVVSGSESDEELDSLTERGFTLVRVHQVVRKENGDLLAS